jgi:hypothetical protein
VPRRPHFSINVIAGLVLEIEGLEKPLLDGPAGSESA